MVGREHAVAGAARVGGSPKGETAGANESLCRAEEIQFVGSAERRPTGIVVDEREVN